MMPENTLQSVREELVARQKTLKVTIDRATAEDRDLTSSEAVEVENWSKDVRAYKARKEGIEKSEAALAELAGHSKSAEGSRGHLALTSPKAARAIASQMRERAQELGSKALVLPGSTTHAISVEPEVVEQGRRPLSLLEALPAQAAEASIYRYLRQVEFTPNAQIVPAGQEKPVTRTRVEPIDAELKVIATLSEPVDTSLLQDFDQLDQFIARQLLWAVARELERQVIDGSGEGDEFAGILATTGVQQQEFLGDPLTTLAAAQSRLEVLGFTPGVFVVSPDDYVRLITARDQSGSLDFRGDGAPVDAPGRRIWGTSAVLSAAVADGTALALDPRGFLIRFGAAGLKVDWDLSGELFRRNQAQARVEGRFAVDIRQPQAAVVIELAAA